MGKRNFLSRSDHSLHSSNNKMNAISAKKIKITRRKSRLKTRKSIKKLFERLRRESNECIVIEDVLPPNDDSVILSSTPLKNSSPINCSTPILPNHKNRTLKDLNISGVDGITGRTVSLGTTSMQNFNDEVNSITKEINRDSYLTIDLTTETDRSSRNATVIDLVNTSEQDCMIVSASNSSISLSGESDVTVLHNPKRSKEKHIHEFANGISRLNASDKGRLLELITQKIFSNCNIPDNVKRSINRNQKISVSQMTDTAEDLYIKEIILGTSSRRNSIGSNIYNPDNDIKNKTGLRMIVIDGSNVAMEHGRGKMFSVKGLKICIDYFLKRGHVVKAFVPRFRCKYGKCTDPRVLDDLERRGLVVYTPSREIQGKMITSYDDRYIVQCAAEFDGIIVSGDNYRDLLRENARWRSVIENRLLPFTWVNDMIMFPRDPMGRNGPTLEQFLKHTPINNNSNRNR